MAGRPPARYPTLAAGLNLLSRNNCRVTIEPTNRPAGDAPAATASFTTTAAISPAGCGCAASAACGTWPGPDRCAVCGPAAGCVGCVGVKLLSSRLPVIGIDTPVPRIAALVRQPRWCPDSALLLAVWRPMHAARYCPPVPDIARRPGPERACPHARYLAHRRAHRQRSADRSRNVVLELDVAEFCSLGRTTLTVARRPPAG